MKYSRGNLKKVITYQSYGLSHGNTDGNSGLSGKLSLSGEGRLIGMRREEQEILLNMGKSVNTYILLRNELDNNFVDKDFIQALASKIISEYIGDMPLFELIDIIYVARSKIPYAKWDSLNRLCFLRYT